VLISMGGLMFSAMRRRLTFANVAMTLALVFAMSGGAYAAKKYLITSTKQISPSVLKALAGKSGPAGPQGSPGAPGKDGAQGLKGDTGAEGKQGIQGEPGKDGKVGATGPTGATGPVGATGAKGATGLTGPTGPTCNQKGECNLPSGASETGAWATPGIVVFKEPFEEEFFISLSFPLHLTFEPEVKFVGPEASETSGAVAGCPGRRVEPKAAPGNLCMYSYGFGLEKVGGGGPITDGTSGAIVTLGFEKGQTFGFLTGSWAVKAP
jgi:hypothetical protein